MDGRLTRYLREEEERVMATRQLAAAARKAAGPWIATLRPWDLYLTLTYDPKRVRQERVFGVDIPRRVCDGKARADVFRLLRQSEGILRRPIAAVVALEYQRNGWPHFHGLADLGGLGGWEIEVMGRLWFKIGGGNKIREVWKSGADAVAVYCAKYLNKDLGSGDVIFTDGLLRERGDFQLPMERPRLGW